MKILKNFGDWSVHGTTGDLSVTYLDYYEIGSERLLAEHDWLEHLRGKTWFTEKQELDFLRAVYWCLLHKDK